MQSYLLQIETTPQVSAAIPGCNYIYAPKGQAGEYSPLAANPYRDLLPPPLRNAPQRMGLMVGSCISPALTSG